MDRHAEQFTCAVQTRADQVLVRPIGELDCYSVGAVERQLRNVYAGGARRIELDLGALTFLDSSGVALVVRWSRASSEGGFVLRVTNGSPGVRRLFEIMAITHLLDDPSPEQIV